MRAAVRSVSVGKHSGRLGLRGLRAREPPNLSVTYSRKKKKPHTLAAGAAVMPVARPTMRDHAPASMGARRKHRLHQREPTQPSAWAPSHQLRSRARADHERPSHAVYCSSRIVRALASCPGAPTPERNARHLLLTTMTEHRGAAVVHMDLLEPLHPILDLQTPMTAATGSAPCPLLQGTAKPMVATADARGSDRISHQDSLGTCGSLQRGMQVGKHQAWMGPRCVAVMWSAPSSLTRSAFE